jgi:hypothetical protein
MVGFVIRQMAFEKLKSAINLGDQSGFFGQLVNDADAAIGNPLIAAVNVVVCWQLTASVLPDFPSCVFAVFLRFFSCALSVFWRYFLSLEMLLFCVTFYL